MVILALVGWIASISILLWIGVILAIVGLVLNFVPIGGSTRRWYWPPVRTTGPGPARADRTLRCGPEDEEARNVQGGWAHNAWWLCS